MHRNPRSGEEGLAASQAIVRARDSGKEIGNLNPANGDLLGKGNIGQFALLPYRGKSAWRGVSFADIQLAFTAENFSAEGVLHPFVPKGKIPLNPLGGMASLGGKHFAFEIKSC